MKDFVCGEWCAWLSFSSPWRGAAGGWRVWRRDREPQLCISADGAQAHWGGAEPGFVSEPPTDGDWRLVEHVLRLRPPPVLRPSIPRRRAPWTLPRLRAARCRSVPHTLPGPRAKRPATGPGCDNEEVEDSPAGTSAIDTPPTGASDLAAPTTRPSTTDHPAAQPATPRPRDHPTPRRDGPAAPLTFATSRRPVTAPGCRGSVTGATTAWAGPRGRPARVGVGGGAGGGADLDRAAAVQRALSGSSSTLTVRATRNIGRARTWS